MDQFTKSAKSQRKDADEFYKALSNIGPAWVKAFQSAPTQTDRLRVLMNALKSTSDEAARANLSMAAFGTDNERLMGIFAAGSGAMQGLHRRGSQAWIGNRRKRRKKSARSKKRAVAFGSCDD